MVSMLNRHKKEERALKKMAAKKLKTRPLMHGSVDYHQLETGA